MSLRALQSFLTYGDSKANTERGFAGLRVCDAPIARAESQVPVRRSRRCCKEGKRKHGRTEAPPPRQKGGGAAAAAAAGRARRKRARRPLRRGMGRLGRLVRRSPWLCNVLLYGGLFAAGDAAQQRLRGRPGQGADWAQTRHVALVALAFHGNFNYVWLRTLERLLPGRAPAAVLTKVFCDQLVGGPVALLAFYTGMSVLQGKEDIFADCREKFWNTYKTGLMYWPLVQLSNFSLIPVYLRTAYTGLCGFVWATFLCFSQQNGDGTARSAFLLFCGEKADPGKASSGK